MNESNSLIAVVVALAVALGTVFGLVLTATGESGHPDLRAGLPRHRATVPPPVLPLAFADMSPDQARAFNARTPIVAGGVASAGSFVYKGLAADRARAQVCLAAAVLYEAGDDHTGEQAVAQVVLNRLRHPAFPKTVCGVVFQGSERASGCQFTFTCDGALARRPNRDAWSRSNAVAGAALDGFVYRPIGTATHYHADWVVPYWHASLLKIAVVHTQIFYRWPGPWGSPQVLRGQAQPPEHLPPAIAALAGSTVSALLPSDDQDGEATQPLPSADLTIDGVPAAALRGSIVRLADTASEVYVLQLNPSINPASFALIGLTVCGGKPLCIMLGWTSQQALPSALPVPDSAIHTVAFIYRKVPGDPAPQLLWDCERFPRRNPAECLESEVSQLRAPLP